MYTKLTTLAFAYIALVAIHVDAATATAKRMKFDDQILALAADIKQALRDDPRVKGQRLSIGQFVGEGKPARDSSSGPLIEKQLRTALGEVVDDDSDFTLAGSYHFAPAESPDNANLRVLVITAVIKSPVGRPLVPITREVNETDDIFRVLGLTGSAPHKPDASPQERNNAARTAATEPSFELVHDTFVAAKGLRSWSVGVRKKSTAAGPARVVPPHAVKGFAFVAVNIADYYEIELANDDAADAVASVSVDGLDVANTFSVDTDAAGKRIRWPGFLVPARERIVLRGWLHTIQPSRSKDNVFSFLVTELGKGAATALKTRGEVGVITVQFREACNATSKLSGRSFGETTKGEGLEEKFTIKNMQIGENVLSTVSIRYNRPR